MALRSIDLDPKEHPHLDHGYAVTSHSSQGQTADRVLIHVDTGLAAKDLLNNRMAYVAVSRGAHDAQIFTGDRERLAEALGREVSHESARGPEVAQQVAGPQQEVEKPPKVKYETQKQQIPERELSVDLDEGYGLGL